MIYHKDGSRNKELIPTLIVLELKIYFRVLYVGYEFMSTGSVGPLGYCYGCIFVEWFCIIGKYKPTVFLVMSDVIERIV